MTKTKMEQAALMAWKIWGDGYALFCKCDGCGEMKHCRGKKRSKMLCLDCWDAS